MEPNCKQCKENNHGWCKKYNLQKPEAVIECMADTKKEKKSQRKSIKIRSLEIKSTKETGLTFNDEELDIIKRALLFNNKYYYENEIQDKEWIIQNNDDEEEQKLNNQVIIDAYTTLLDKLIEEQEKLTNIIDKIEQNQEGEE